jgi:hypothetical protein
VKTPYYYDRCILEIFKNLSQLYKVYVPLFVPNIFLSVQPEDFADQAVGWNDQPGSQKFQIRTLQTKADKLTSRGSEATRGFLLKFSVPKLMY